MAADLRGVKSQTQEIKAAKELAKIEAREARDARIEARSRKRVGSHAENDDDKQPSKKQKSTSSKGKARETVATRTDSARNCECTCLDDATADKTFLDRPVLSRIPSGMLISSLTIVF